MRLALRRRWRDAAAVLSGGRPCALHFISGLPRSGSTLLAGLLRQNPRFAAAMTGPVGGLVGALLNAMSPQNETAVFLDEAKRQAILRAVVEAYYADQADKAVVFDTNRMWSARLPLIAALYPRGAGARLRAQRRLDHGQLRAAGAAQRLRAVAAVRDRRRSAPRSTAAPRRSGIATGWWASPIRR